MALWLQALLWGLFGGSTLVIGAGVGYFAKVPRALIAWVMAFGAGVLIAALSLELMEHAYRNGGTVPAALGFLLGALVFTLANVFLSRRGAKHRKRSGAEQPRETHASGSGLAIAFGALLDGIPESVAIGVSLLRGGAVSWVMVAAVFLSNFPEGLSSSAGMRKAGRSPAYVLGVWTGIAVLSGIAALVGETVFRGFPPAVLGTTLAVAAGAILAMLADTMIPEAFAESREWAGFMTVAGFLAAFTLSKMS